uniref:Putative secreted protein n=1 Tax=Anopheles darlingi TaxID=43151 RepID=A0A2M4D8J6_ANODA
MVIFVLWPAAAAAAVAAGAFLCSIPACSTIPISKRSILATSRLPSLKAELVRTLRLPTSSAAILLPLVTLALSKSLVSPSKPTLERNRSPGFTLTMQCASG